MWVLRFLFMTFYRMDGWEIFSPYSFFMSVLRGFDAYLNGWLFPCSFNRRAVFQQQMLIIYLYHAMWYIYLQHSPISQHLCSWSLRDCFICILHLEGIILLMHESLFIWTMDHSPFVEHQVTVDLSWYLGGNGRTNNEHLSNSTEQCGSWTH